MKPLRLLLPIVSFLVWANSMYAQNNSTKKSDPDIFAAGKNSYRWMETGYYGYMKNTYNGADRGHSNDTYIDIKGTHWFGGGFGAGLGIEADWNGNHYIADQRIRDWMISPSL